MQLFNLRKLYFVEVDELLDKIEFGQKFLNQPEIVEITKKELHKHDGSLYNLVAYTIMSNHVHILIDTDIQLESKLHTENLLENYISLDHIMKLIKGATARYSNIFLARTGQFWEKESFDMYIRNEKMHNNIIKYILNNPVKAEIVENWPNYPGNYWKEGIEA